MSEMKSEFPSFRDLVGAFHELQKLEISLPEMLSEQNRSLEQLYLRITQSTEKEDPMELKKTITEITRPLVPIGRLLMQTHRIAIFILALHILDGEIQDLLNEISSASQTLGNICGLMLEFEDEPIQYFLC